MTGYRERLLPSWWVWVFALALVAMVAVAYGAALGQAAGLIVAASGGALAVWLLWITSPVTVVDERGLGVAGARLPPGVIGTVEPLDKAQLAGLRGPGADARVFTALRPWSASAAILVEVDDVEDPHPAWLISTRHPARLCASIRSVCRER